MINTNISPTARAVTALFSKDEIWQKGAGWNVPPPFHFYKNGNIAGRKKHSRDMSHVFSQKQHGGFSKNRGPPKSSNTKPSHAWEVSATNETEHMTTFPAGTQAGARSNRRTCNGRPNRRILAVRLINTLPRTKLHNLLGWLGNGWLYLPIIWVLTNG